jgi:long-chain acyl-CoA synthetase
MLRINSLVTVALVALSVANAFQPAVLPRAVRRQVAATSNKATIQDEERMTNEDIEVLFGEEAEYVPDPPFPGRHRKVSKTGNILVDENHPIDPNEHSSSNPLANKLHTMREMLTNCPQLWAELAKNCGSERALFDERLCDETIDVTFAEMNDLVQKSAAVFQKFGVKKGTNVAIFAENSARWLVCDHGIQLAGGASAVRGAEAPLDELRYIYEHSDSAGTAVLQGPKLLNKLAKDAKAKKLSTLGLSNPSHGPVKNIILLNREKMTNKDIEEIAQANGVKVYVFADLLAETSPLDSELLPEVGPEDLATLVYTSGTTGRPKGVMITHANMLHQSAHRLGPSLPYDECEPLPGETMVSILPVWHITERAFEIWLLSRGCNIAYSNIRYFKNDLAKHKPQWMVLVPRVLEKIAAGVQDKFASGSPAVQILSKTFTKTSEARAANNKILNDLVVGDQLPGPLEKAKAKTIIASLAPANAIGDKLVWSKVIDGFGGRLKTIIAGGSALAGSLEQFYEAAGINILVGYGLTECSPILSFRRRDANLVTAGCAGKPAVDTEIRVVDPESKPTETAERKALPDGTAGVIIARGPQVMKGYYKNPEATAKAIDKFGWFDTGDLGRINPATGDLILTGRAKDTIVLSNGENVEPIPLEDAIMSESPLIDQVMLTGQDGRGLVAIVVLNPNELANEGYLDAKAGSMLQAQSDKVNDPQCTEEACKEGCQALSEASTKLRRDENLAKALKEITTKATKTGFRPWEKVSEVFLTLEPFAMANGQLTQSYKVKRAQVTERYGDEI